MSYANNTTTYPANDNADLHRPASSGSHVSDEKASNASPNYAVNDGAAEAGYTDPYTGVTKIPVDHGFDPVFLKKTMRKIDWRVVPYLAALYSISLIDRTNIALARAAGMGRALELQIPPRYTIAVIAFFIPYILLEIPSQIGLRKFGAAIWLSSAVLLWGIAMMAMAFVTNWQQLAGLRAVVGAFEAALFPGAAYLISCWYVRRQVQIRLSLFYVMSIFITGLSSILAYGLSLIGTINDTLDPWQWIFFVEGLLTIALGLIGYFVIVDFPDKSKFLTEEQKQMVLTRIERDRADAVADSLTWKKTLNYAMDVKLWLYALMFGGSTTGSYALSYFLPQILAGMGFGVAESQILVAPPYVWAVIPAIVTGYLSDRTGIRSIWIAVNAITALVGLCLFSFLPFANTAGRYAGVFLCAGGVNANVPLVIGWAQVSIRAQSKRGYTSGLIVAFGGVGGIISAVTFLEREAPTYRTGVAFTIACQIFIVLCCAGLSFFYRLRNRAADNGDVVLEDHPDFRYQL